MTQKSIGLVLAIEAAVSGGSVAVIDNGRDAGSWHGTTAVSRAEELLPEISALLERTMIQKNDLDLIAVSNGPGSYTGIRIGLATALGLARALNIECVGVPLLSAIAKMRLGQSTIAVIPMGRGELCWQRFEPGNLTSDPVTGSISDLLDISLRYPQFVLVAHRDAFELISENPDFAEMACAVEDCGRNLALLIGTEAGNITSDLTPNYVRNAQFRSIPV